MKQVFILQNQHKQFLTKQGEWTDGRDGNTLYRTEHKDEAINQQFEASSKDYTLRLTLIECSLNERGVPIIPVDNLSDAMGMPEVVAADDIDSTDTDSSNIDTGDSDAESFILADIDLDDVVFEEADLDEDLVDEVMPASTDGEDGASQDAASADDSGAASAADLRC